VQLYRYFVI